MRQTFYLLFLVQFLLQGCVEQKSNINSFSELDDTLIIFKTAKLPGSGLFRFGAGEKNFRDTANLKTMPWFNDFPINDVVFPNNVKNIKIAFHTIVLYPANRFKFYDSETKQDILFNYPNIAESQIIMMTGTIEDDTVYIVDQNNNRDFTDDPVRSFLPFDWFGTENLIECNYEIYRNDELIIDTGWFTIGIYNGRLLEMTHQHILSEFSIGKSSFTVAIGDENSGSFCFIRPQLALFGQNEATRDTLLMRDYISKGEYIKLGDDYYKFQDFYNGCGTVILIKEKEMASKIGLQVGLIAPQMKFVTTSGDTISSDELKDDYLLLANVSGCTPRSYNVYSKILKENIPNLTIIGLDYGKNIEFGGIMVDVTDNFNQEIYRNYRNAYSSYDTYLINKEGRVIDKLNLFDLENSLSRITDSIR